ncbi:hypothetical protein DPMN_173693 [Dreissena polymorpha]|uniref:Uncharacterized protein n=1 Tax=Dreissena polymorpha TaxID=45954 RepID=A0A9D4IEF8_DREPO|nr:hypothetical protein DPMN_173693 [Dreissena polymorpha]
MAKFKNDFRKKLFRDNKHLGTLGADKLLNETGNRDMEITKKTTKPTADSTVPHKKVAKKLTYDYQPSLYTEESSCEKQPTPVVMKSGLENKRYSSPNRRGMVSLLIILNRSCINNIDGNFLLLFCVHKRFGIMGCT